jgi:hypothetical protein
MLGTVCQIKRELLHLTSPARPGYSSSMSSLPQTRVIVSLALLGLGLLLRAQRAH